MAFHSSGGMPALDVPMEKLAGRLLPLGNPGIVGGPDGEAMMMAMLVVRQSARKPGVSVLVE